MVLLRKATLYFRKSLSVMLPPISLLSHFHYNDRDYIHCCYLSYLRF